MFLGRWHGALVAVKVLHSGWGQTAEENLRTECCAACAEPLNPYAQVFLGRWHGALVAVKVLHSGWGQTAEENLRTEAKLLCSLRFPNVLTFLTAYVNCYPMMIVTEYCAGGDLGRALRLDQGTPRRCAPPACRV